MAYNKGLQQLDKDRINQGVKDLAAQGKSKEEILAWRDSQVEAASASAEPGKTNPAAGQGAPAVSTGSASGDGVSELQSIGDFSQTAGQKKERVDDDGEVVNLAKDFGEIGAIVESIPFIGDLVDDMYGAVKSGWAQGQTVDDALSLFAKGTDADEETLQGYIAAVENQQNQPVSKEMQDFNDTYEASGGGAWGFVKAIAQNPSVAATTAVSSMVAMINPGSAAGAAIGAGGGAGLGAAVGGVGAIPGAIGGAFAGAGGILETGASFTEFLQEELAEKGLPFDEAGIAKVLEDENALFRIRSKSAARGGVIAIIDGLTAGVASKAAKGVAGAAKKASKLKGVLAATAIEGAGGGIGEAAARKVVGQELDAREIGLEIVGEFGTGVTLGKAAVETQPKYKINGQAVTRNDVQALVDSDPAALGTVEVSNDPGMKSVINEKISGSKDINNNVDIITKEETESRNELVDKIAKSKKEQLAFKKGSPEFRAYSAIINKQRTELKDVVKAQNENYKYLNSDQKNAIIGAKAEADNFDKAIANIENKYKNKEQVSPEDQALIDNFTELKNETLESAEQARAEGVALGQQKAAERAARAEAKAQEEAIVDEAEELGVDTEQFAAIKEEANAEIDEEATDNGQAIDGLTDSLLENGIELKPINGAIDASTPDNYIPLSKDQDTYSKGDFEKTVSTLEPIDLVTAKQQERAIVQEAKSKGWDANVETVQQGDGFVVEGTIKAAKRQEPKSVEIQNKQPDNVNPQGHVVGEKVDVDEEGPVNQRKARSEAEQTAAPAEFITPERYKGVEQISDDTFQLGHENQIHKLRNDVAGRNYEVVENEDGTVTLAPGEPDFNIAEKGQLRLQQQASKVGSGPQRNKKKEGYRKRKHKARDIDYNVDEVAQDETPSAPKNFQKHNNLRDIAGKRIKLNIGLENNPIDNIEGIIKKLDSDPRVRLGTTEQVDGEYNGEPERTVVVDAKFDGTARDFRSYIEKLNADLTQEAIGAQYDGRGSLIYDPKFKGEKYTFDPQFFLQPSTDTDKGVIDVSEESVTGQKVKKTPDLKGFTETQKRRLTPYGINPKWISSGNKISKDNLDAARARFDKLVGVEGAWQNPEQYRNQAGDAVSTEFRVALAGGKGGFGSSVDKVEQAKTAEGRYLNAVDFLKGVEAAYKGEVPKSQFSEVASQLGEQYKGKPLGPDEIAFFGGERLSDLVLKSGPTDVEYTYDEKRAKAPKDKGGSSFIADSVPGTIIDPQVQGLLDKIKTLKEEGAPKEEIAKIEDKIKDLKSKDLGGIFGELKGARSIDKSLIDDYNDGLISDNDFGKSIANYMLRKVKKLEPKGITAEQLGTYTGEDGKSKLKSRAGYDKNLQGFALGKLADQIVKGNFKGKTLQQVFSKAKSIAAGSRADQREAYGESRRRQARTNVVSRADDAFQSQFGYEPSFDELADYINDRATFNDKSKTKERLVYNIDKPITEDQVKDIKFSPDDRPLGDELSGVQGTVKERSQDRLIDEAGLGQDLSTEVLSPRDLERIDDAASKIFDEAPVITEGPASDKKLKESNTRIDQDIRKGISEIVSAGHLKEAFPYLKETLGLKPNSWNDLSSKEKRSLKNRVVDGLFLEAENRLGKTATRSQQLDFDIEPGDATFTTDLGKRSKQQVNSHRRPWDQTAKELNDTIRKTDFDNDWVQWSPGHLDPTSNKAKRMDPRRVAELGRQPARVYKMVSKQGLELRKDSRNPGLYHIHKPGKPGSKPDFNLTEGEAKSKASPKFLKDVTAKLQEAWPGYNINTTPQEWSDKISQLRLDGVSMPWNQVKGFVTGNNIYLSPTKVGYDTPIHEFGHVWEKQLQRENPELWKKGRELLKGSEYARTVYNIPKYKSYLKDNPIKFWGEVMANAIGKRGAVLFDSKNKANTWDKWMKSVSDWIKNTLGIESKKDYNDLTLDDWLNIAVQGTFTGKTPKAIKPQVEFSVEESISDALKSPEVKSKVLQAVEEKAAQRAAKQASKEDNWFKRASDWFVGPAADDFHGLVDRFQRKNPGNSYNKKFDALKKAYVEGYNNFEVAATEARDSFKKAGDELASTLGISPKKLDNYLAGDSGVDVDGVPITINEALSLYINPEGISSDVIDSIKDNVDSNVLEFAENLPFKLDGDSISIQQALLDHINKDLLKQNLSSFLEMKKANFSKAQVEKLGSTVGKGYADALNDALFRMGGGSKQGAGTETSKWSDWLQGSVGAIMFLNVRSAMLQGLSIWNYMSAGNILGFNRDLAAIAVKGSEQNKLFNELWNNPMMKERRARAGFDVNANEIVEAINEGRFGKSIAKLLNKGFVLTSAMDSVAIAAGGSAFVKDQMSQGVSKEDAINAWKDKTQESQQSARPDRVSKQQKASVSKFILAFANTPAQYFRLSQKAYRVFKDPKSSSAQKLHAAKQIAYYMAVQNAIFTMAQSASTALFMGWGGEEDERKEAENALNSMTDTWLRGMGLAGAVGAALKNSAINAYRESKKANPNIGQGLLKGAVGVAPPLSRKINDIIAIGNTYKYDKDKTGVRSANVVAGSKALAAGANIPADWLQKKLAAAQLLYQGEADFLEFLQMFGGYSEYSVLGKDKDKGEFGGFEFNNVDFGGEEFKSSVSF